MRRPAISSELALELRNPGASSEPAGTHDRFDLANLVLFDLRRTEDQKFVTSAHWHVVSLGFNDKTHR